MSLFPARAGRLLAATFALCIGAQAALAQSGPRPGDDAAARRDLDARLRRVESIKAIERLQNVFGYYTDRFLFDQPPTLFASHGVEVHYDGGVWLGRAGVDRFWKGYMRRHLAGGAKGPVAGSMFDQPQVQGVIDVAADGLSAKARFRTLGRAAHYGQSEDWIAGVYENDYVLEDGQWKLRVFRYCTTWTAPYLTGQPRPIKPPEDMRVGSPDGPDRLEPGACVGDDLTRTLPPHFAPNIVAGAKP